MTQEFAPLKTVAILGCGPAGLLAAHAVGLTGQPMSIHSVPTKSVIGGAQFLHEPIPLLHDASQPSRVLTYRTQGTALGYREKVYGLSDPETMPDTVSMEGVHDGQEVPAWDLVETYDYLWDAFGQSLNEAHINEFWLEAHANEFRLIISTIPKRFLCMDRARHRFTQQTVYVDPTPPTHLEPDSIVYNGEKSPSWYRASRIGDHGGTEWSDRTPAPPGVERIAFQKPLRNTCDCWPNVVHVGRYGAWRKGVLLTDAFREAWLAAGTIA